MYLRTASFGIVFTVALATGAEARAAFMSPELESWDEGTGSGSTGSSQNSRIDDRSHDLATPVQPGAPASRFYTRTGRGMNSTSPSVSIGVGAAGFALSMTEAHLTGGQLVTRLEREGRCDLPPPHLDGVFRPPRACS